MSTETKIIAKPTSSTNTTTPTLSPTITLGFVALQRTFDEHVGETRKQTRHAASLVPLRVRSIAADGAFVPLASSIRLDSSSVVIDSTFRPVAKADIALPGEKNTGQQHQTLEFDFERIPVFGLVKTRDSQLSLVAIDTDDELTLPLGFEMVGLLAAPVGTHRLKVYDTKTDDAYQLGYVFPNTIQPDWVGLAQARREEVLAERAAERREREAERRAELEEDARVKKEKLEWEASLAKPVPTFATSDKEVVYQMQEAYAVKYRRRIAVTRSASDQPYFVEDPENLGPAIAEGVAAKREELGSGADAYFERERDAREYAASLQK
jgi:hypothetical protein